jgi:hypothetical protein
MGSESDQIMIGKQTFRVDKTGRVFLIAVDANGKATGEAEVPENIAAQVRAKIPPEGDGLPHLPGESR